jgi:dTMP kinase
MTRQYDGKYIVFEGGDYAGKSTTLSMVALKLQEICDRKVHITRHPGSTELGGGLRELIKNKNLVVDPIARQCVYAADAINFVNTMLIPALENGDIVLADRSSFISGLIYSSADEISKETYNKIWTIVNPPKIDRLYILQCDDSTLLNRMALRSNEDHYDNKPFEFMKAVHDQYSNLVMQCRKHVENAGGCFDKIERIFSLVDVNDVIGVDSSRNMGSIVESIIGDIRLMIHPS